jgi:hypothetical protein
MTYESFLDAKAQMGSADGFEPIWMPDFLFDFQKHLVHWSLLKGRAAKFADCGLGKTPMQLVWAENIVRKTNKRVLIITPLAVGHQTLREGAKFGMTCERSSEGKFTEKIVVTNYERLHYFNPNDFVGAVCDESSILKNFDGVTRKQVTEFMRTLKYRLLCTATAAPNDFIELGTSSEAIGELGFMDMIGRFFKKQETACRRADELKSGMWRFRGHAERDFWRWVCSWSRAVRKPSDLGFKDKGFKLPPLVTNEHIVSARTRNPEWLFDMPAISLEEQRKERKRTIPERCELAARLANHDKSVVAWCDLNEEAKLLRQLIPDAVEISGSDSDERKEEIFQAFGDGQIRALITKKKIAGYGLNWQHCSHQVGFASHSFEQWYQAIRRCWRFGQKNTVNVDMICSEGERGVLLNLKRKADACDRMFSHLVDLMNNELRIERVKSESFQPQIPIWLNKN